LTLVQILSHWIQSIRISLRSSLMLSSDLSQLFPSGLIHVWFAKRMLYFLLLHACCTSCPSHCFLYLFLKYLAKRTHRESRNCVSFQPFTKDVTWYGLYVS
jgi:hypothetical protein